MRKYGNIEMKWDNTITCRGCGMKKHIGINEGIEDCIDRANLILHEQMKARCCKSPDYAMYPEGE